MDTLTKHHAIPRTLHGNKRVRKQFTKEQCIGTVLWLCRPCHSNIHKVLSEKQMAAEFYTVEALLLVPEVKQFTQWIQNKPVGFKAKH